MESAKALADQLVAEALAKIEEMEREVFHLYGPGEDNLDAITKKITQEINAE